MKKFNINLIFNGETFTFEKVYIAIDASMLFIKKDDKSLKISLYSLDTDIIGGFNLEFVNSITLTECTEEGEEE